jgi:hypothetical protein
VHEFLTIRKEVIPVTYEKPVLVELVNAVDAVQASMQKMAPPTDFSGLTTVAAYECDEA